MMFIFKIALLSKRLPRFPKATPEPAFGRTVRVCRHLRLVQGARPLPVAPSSRENLWVAAFLHLDPVQILRCVLIPKIRLLVVDDERLMRMSLRMVLGEEGYQVDTAKNVSEAQNLLDQYPYQVLITDLELPDGKGFEIIRYARKLNGALESILLTGRDDPVDEDEALLAGAGSVIHKPCELSSVVLATFKATTRAGLAAGHRQDV